ncbi:unnamed protein product [Spirodela intermedia]|uniref:BZIP domain-containing protein n=1 Tax=Spirodela intermedia TaxID=51605 RepID=A0A7I8JDJ5_SPIIN|nr:unnamed protein product [Spirodela intermedia]CAA6667583.1 unnamed protein product [Spirodela intermedia]
MGTRGRPPAEPRLVRELGQKQREERAVGHGGPRRGGGAAAAPWGRKRVLDGPTEKVLERRQRRMMKNRESAARSRARKQAYTVELEKELNFLKEENARLKDEQRILGLPRGKRSSLRQ